MTDLRKEALYLENEIDTKLVSYSKVGANATFTFGTERYVIFLYVFDVLLVQ